MTVVNLNNGQLNFSVEMSSRIIQLESGICSCMNITLRSYCILALADYSSARAN